MIVSFVTCGDDEEKESNFSPVPEGPKKGRHRYNQFCLLEFDGAPEISGSPWCPSFKEDSWVLFKWEREGSRHQSAWKTRSGLPGDSLGWVGHYGNSVSMLVRWEGGHNC